MRKLKEKKEKDLEKSKRNLLPLIITSQELKLPNQTPITKLTLYLTSVTTEVLVLWLWVETLKLIGVKTVYIIIVQCYNKIVHLSQHLIPEPKVVMEGIYQLVEVRKQELKRERIQIIKIIIQERKKLNKLFLRVKINYKQINQN